MDNYTPNMNSDEDSDYVLESEDDEEYDENDYLVEKVTNNYCDELNDAVDLKLKNTNYCLNVCHARGTLGLFKLFFSDEFVWYWPA